MPGDGRTHWRNLYRVLWHSDLRLAPADVDRLTMGEIDLALDADSRPRPSDGSLPVVMSPGEVAAEMARRQQMTLADRLDEARGG